MRQGKRKCAEYRLPCLRLIGLLVPSYLVPIWKTELFPRLSGPCLAGEKVHSMDGGPDTPAANSDDVNAVPGHAVWRIVLWDLSRLLLSVSTPSPWQNTFPRLALPFVLGPW